MAQCSFLVFLFFVLCAELSASLLPQINIKTLHFSMHKLVYGGFFVVVLGENGQLYEMHQENSFDQSWSELTQLTWYEFLNVMLVMSFVCVFLLFTFI